jgi:F-type H+-transporting ATPase subunit delta
MAEVITIARPYAEAVFKSAKANKTIAAWSDMLKYAAAISKETQVRTLIGNPSISAKQLTDVFLAICTNKLNEEGRNLITLMAENGRLDVLPQVSELYEQLKSQHEGVLDAKIVSAFELNAAQLRKLIVMLEKKYKHEINAKVSVDPELIGGVKVEIGDEILDTSVRGKLEAMAVALKS